MQPIINPVCLIPKCYLELSIMTYTLKNYAAKLTGLLGCTLVSLCSGVSSQAAFAACSSSGTTMTCIDGGINPDQTTGIQVTPPATNTVILRAGYNILTTAPSDVGVKIFNVTATPQNLTIQQDAGATVTATGPNSAHDLSIINFAGTSSIITGGQLRTSSNGGDAAAITGSGDSTIHQLATGQAISSGNNGSGFVASTNTGTATVIQDAGGTLSVSNAASAGGVYGILALAGNMGNTNMQVNGSVSTAPNFSYGISTGSNGAGNDSVALGATSTLSAADTGVSMRKANSAAGNGNQTFSQAAGSTVTAGSTALEMVNQTGGTISATVAGILQSGNQTSGDGFGNTHSVELSNIFFGTASITNPNATLSVQSTGVINSNSGRAIGNRGANMSVFNAGTITGDVDSSTTTATTDSFTNQSGGKYSGNMRLGAGNDTVILQSGSTTSGTIDMGTGSDTVTVQAGVNISGITNFNGGDDVSSADGQVDTITIQRQNLSVTGAYLTNWENVNLDNTVFNLVSGTLAVGAGAGTGLFLTNAAQLLGSGSFAMTGNLSLASGTLAAFAGGGSGTPMIAGNVINNGTISLNDGVAGDVLGIIGNYSGSGTLALDTLISSGTSQADMVNISGNTSGVGVIRVVNSGTTGGPTTGNGIELVSVGGTSAGTYTLAAPVYSGAFNYGLAKADGQNWYLQSTVKGGAAGGAVLPILADDFGMAFLGTRQERVGEQQRGGDAPSNIWGRGIVREAMWKQNVLGGIDASSGLMGVQLGMDLAGREEGRSSKRIGVYGGLGAMHGTATPARGAPDTLSANGKVAALYASVDVRDDYYLDGVLQAEWLDAKSSGSGITANTNGNGILASLEGGKDFQLGETSLFEAQAQLIYARTQLDGIRDSTGAAYGFGANETVTGRAGFRIKGDARHPNGGSASGWLKANLWAREALQNQETDISGTLVQQPKQNVWADVGIGFDVKTDKNLSLFGDLDVEIGLTSASMAFAAKSGIRWEF